MSRVPASLALLAAAAIAAPARAQALLPAPEATAPGTTSVATGLEPHVTIDLAHTHALSTGAARRYRLGAGARVAPLILGDHEAWRVHAIAAVDWPLAGRWALAVAAMPYLAHDVNAAAELHGLGLELRALPALRLDGWTLGLDLGWQLGALTHVRHGAASRDAFDDRYPDGMAGAGPRDGWYGLTAQRYRLGFAAAWTMSSSVALHTTLGALVNRQRQGVLFGFDMGQIPVYVQLGVSVRW